MPHTPTLIARTGPAGAPTTRAAVRPNTHWALMALLGLSALWLAGCERPPMQAVQGGFRGTGMVQVYNPRHIEAQEEINAEPDIAKPARIREGQPKAGEAYENVQVLGDLTLAEFGRTMTAIAAWVAPEQGCSYCHVEGNLASDDLYTKKVARRMFQMTQYINANWSSHVAETGVTCYTCHRGNPVPVNHWAFEAPPDRRSDFIGERAGQNQPSTVVAGSSLPSAVFQDYLLDDKPIRINGKVALAAGGEAANRSSIKQAEHTYGLMVHMSKALGVNCTFCHNAQAMQSWEGSSQQRVTAWYGIRMARTLNRDFFTSEPLITLFPAERRGPMGDIVKVNCATCHQGAYKPLYGSHLSRYYPAVVPLALRPEVPPTPPTERQPLPPVRGELRATYAKDPALAPR